MKDYIKIFPTVFHFRNTLNFVMFQCFNRLMKNDGLFLRNLSCWIKELSSIESLNPKWIIISLIWQTFDCFFISIWYDTITLRTLHARLLHSNKTIRCSIYTFIHIIHNNDEISLNTFRWYRLVIDISSKFSSEVLLTLPTLTHV